jgi:hypothetical protein
VTRIFIKYLSKTKVISYGYWVMGDGLVKSPKTVIPAKLVPEVPNRGAGIQKGLVTLDSPGIKSGAG